MSRVVELSYWNINCYTILYVVFILAAFVVFMTRYNNSDSTSVGILATMTTSHKKDNIKKVIQESRDEYVMARILKTDQQTSIKIERIYKDLASAISTKLTFPKIIQKMKAFRTKYKI